MSDWGKPIYRPWCWLFGHRWLNRGDYYICLRCDSVVRATTPEGEK